MQASQPNKLIQKFIHEQESKFTLTCTYNSLTYGIEIYMIVPTESFPKIYKKYIDNESLTNEVKIVFENVGNLCTVMKDKDNIEIIPNSGIIRVKYTIKMGKENRQKYLDIKMQRSVQNQLDQIRTIIQQKAQNILNIAQVQGWIQKLWRREENNQKIFMKFKQDIEFKVDELAQRINIQNTKMAIIREDVNKLILSFDKLSTIICPIFAKINISSEYTDKFILQDRKIVYIGESAVWTQILFRNCIIGNKKYEFCFKIINSKKCNVVAGITMASQVIFRSSLYTNKGEKAERKYLGLSGTGQLYSHENTSNLGTILLSHHESDHHREKSKQKQSSKQQKSSHQITLPTASITMSQGPRSPMIAPKNNSGTLHEVFKPMQIIKMCIDTQKDRISWKNGSKTLMEYKISLEYKSEAVVPYFQLCDTGDAIQYIDI